jgi:hypothetical protein
MPRTKKKDNYRKLKININWDSDDNGYAELNNNKVFRFVFNSIQDGYNLIQTQYKKPFYANGKTVLHLQAVKCKKWKLTPHWNENEVTHTNDTFLSCTNYVDWIKLSPCAIGRDRAKIFLKLKSNEKIAGFSTYLMGIFSGNITLDKHKIFVNAIKYTFKDKPIYIHNEDVDWFHLKEYFINS